MCLVSSRCTSSFLFLFLHFSTSRLTPFLSNLSSGPWFSPLRTSRVLGPRLHFPLVSPELLTFSGNNKLNWESGKLGSLQLGFCHFASPSVSHWLTLNFTFLGNKIIVHSRSEILTPGFFSISFLCPLLHVSSLAPRSLSLALFSPHSTPISDPPRLFPVSACADRRGRSFWPSSVAVVGRRAGRGVLWEKMAAAVHPRVVRALPMSRKCHREQRPPIGIPKCWEWRHPAAVTPTPRAPWSF